MRKHLLRVLLVFVLIIGMVPVSVFAEDNYVMSDYGSFTSGDQVISALIEKSGMNAHPRIIMTKEKIQALKSHIGDGSVTADLLEELRAEADRIIRDCELPTYDAKGDDHLLETSKRIQRHVAALALAYNIFGDNKYAERGYKELKAACNFPDWSPKHFLDTAEMCTAFAYGYDWLYHWLNPAQRELLRSNMIKKGLQQVMQDYTDTPSDRERTYKWYQDQKGDNWQLVCTGGTNLAALAIGDESDARSIASEVITYGFKRAYSFTRRAYSTKDGTYIEGLGYWDYATYYLGLQSSALKSTTGTDYGLADYEGVRKSVEFVRYMSSNTPTSFSFGDDRDSRNTGWAVFLWLGEQFNAPEYSAVRINFIREDKEFNYLDVLWIDESKQTGHPIVMDTDWGSVGASNASFRDTWDKSGIVTALHVGENNYKYHGHYDLGSFYIEANGSRFFTDLGNENYKLENRQYSYRIKAEGHNTLVINPTEDIDQREGANCLITEFKSGNTAYAVTDLTDAYTPSGAKKVVRGLKLIKDKKCVVIQDEISLNKAGEIYWFAHTKGQISVAGDGKSAIVTVGSDRLWVGLLSANGRFTAMKAEPLSTSKSVPGATKNDEYRKLAIHLTNTKDTTICVVCIPLKNGETKPSWTPSLKAISEWSNADEPQPTKAATPVPTKKVTPVPTAKPTLTPTKKATPVPTKKATPVPTKKVTPVPTVKPTNTPTKKATPRPTGTVTVTPTPITTGTPTPTPNVPKTKMPDVIGMNYRDAKSLITRELKAAGFKTVGFEYEWKTCTDPEQNLKVQETDPEANAVIYLTDTSITVKLVVTKLKSEPMPTSTPRPTSTPVPTGAPGITVTPVPSKAPTGKPTVTPIPKDRPTVGDFIERLYTIALNRESEEEGKAFWINEIESGNRTGGDCAYFFLIEAPEFLNRGLTDEDFVETLYLTFFDRASEEAGKKFWVDSLKSGKMTKKDVIMGFIDSTEWCNVCATYGVKSGAPNAKAEFASQNAIDFATRLYTCCLKRDPDLNGVAYWSLALTNLEQTGYSAAREFFTGKEFLAQRTSNEEYVERLYKTFMGRDPMPDEANYWSGQLENGNQTRQGILEFFGSSEEFRKLCKEYGID